MDAVYLGKWCQLPPCNGSGPWVMADMENGLFSGPNKGYNSADPTITDQFTTAMLFGQANHWKILTGNAQSGGLSTAGIWARPSGYNPMHKEGAIILGIGGDNSKSGDGTFYEGVMTAGYPTDAAQDAVQADIVAAKYTS
jgi:hypothetical protein